MKINISTDRVATLPETNMFCSPENILTTQSWKVSAMGGILGRHLCNSVKCHITYSFICKLYETSVLSGCLKVGGAVVENLPASAGDTGSSPAPGRCHMPRSNYACAPQLLSLCSRARKPQLLSPHATTTEARAPRARAPQQEKPQ